MALDADPEHDLRGAAATFTPRLAFLNLPPDERDPGAVDALHEIAHAETFAGSAFYASFAARTLKGERLPIRPLQGFLEAVPEAFGHVGARAAPGTRPDETVVHHLATLPGLYRARYGDAWRSLGLDLDAATSRAAAIGEVSPDQLVGRTLIQIVARSALELALVRAEGNSPEAHVRMLYEQLVRGRSIEMPRRGESISEHVLRLMGKAKRKIVGLFDDQLLLEDTLLNADHDELLSLRPLLSAVIGLEYFTQSWPPSFDTLFFAHPTADFSLRLNRYVASRALSQEHERTLYKSVSILASAVLPVQDGKPIIVDPDHMEDPNAWNAREVLSLRSYIFALPHFCEQHLAYAPMIGSSCRDAIIALKLSSQQAFEAYLNLIATKAGRPELLNVTEKADLRAGKDDRGADVFFLRMR